MTGSALTRWTFYLEDGVFWDGEGVRGRGGVKYRPGPGVGGNPGGFFSEAKLVVNISKNASPAPPGQICRTIVGKLQENCASRLPGRRRGGIFAHIYDTFDLRHLPGRRRGSIFVHIQNTFGLRHLPGRRRGSIFAHIYDTFGLREKSARQPSPPGQSFTPALPRTPSPPKTPS